MTASVHIIGQFVCSLVQDKRLSLAKIGKFTQLGLLDSRAKSQQKVNESKFDPCLAISSPRDSTL